MIPSVVQRLTRDERRAQTRQQLLDSARALFGQKGFGATSLDEIAETAGLTRGALYYNFPEGKDDLFLALLEDRADERAAAIEQAFTGSSSGDIGTTVRQIQSASGDWARNLNSNREFHQLFTEFALHASREPKFAGAFKQRETSVRRAIAKVIEERALAAGAELPVSPEELALGIIALANGLALEHAVEPRNVPQKLLGQLVGLIILGIGTSAESQRTNGRKGGRA
jgi:AcrR family transcriptional regulator